MNIVMSFFLKSLRRHYLRAVSCPSLSGEELVCNRVEGGNIMPFTVPNPTFFFFVDPLVLTLKADELIPKWNGRPERNTVPNINANQTNGKQQWDNK
mmetsp:Transcript_19303/g.53830  ORF Transcript_19303/g.53830 Transcript_19303/m.53830 type:complete len:97 (-) Transcript_19303:493-783(-)